MESSPMLVLLLLLMSTCDCQNHVFYIKPSDSSHCPQEVNASQCYDLTTLVSEGHLSTAPNISLLFLPGEHFLEQDLYVTNTKVFQMTLYYSKQGNNSVSGVKIACTGYNNYGGHSVRIQNVSLVKINSISFRSCGVELMSVDHSEITDCKWNESRSSAISIQDSNSVISDCQFMSGICSECSGGGIFADSSNMIFTGNNVVTNNSVEQYGGGLSFRGSNIVIDGNLTVGSNLAGTGGGGMYVQNCTFATINTSLLLFEDNIGFGGGIVISASHGTFNGSVVFSGNSAGVNGGGMSVEDGSHSTFYEQVVFSGNSAGGDGGGIAVWDGSHSTFYEQVVFSGNSASRYGGGMSVWYGSHSTFNEQVVFSGNSASRYGGGMSVWDGSHSTFYEQVVFSGNSASWYGGGMSVQSDSHSTFNEQVVFSGNSASRHSGGMAVFTYSNSTFNEQVVFSGNSAGGDGGGMSVEEGSHSTFNEQVVFSDNSAGLDGGGMSVWQGHSTFNEQVVFSGNSAGGDGGGMKVCVYSYSTFNEQVVFSGNNSAGGDGGGMSVEDGSHSTFNEQVVFSGNSAGLDGGGMSVEDGSYSTFNEQVVFSDNSASWYGGGMKVCFYSYSTFNEQVVFSGNNSAGVDGGGMEVYYYSHSTFNEQVVFSDNSAGVDGGGMEVYYYSNSTFNEQVVFSGNSADGDGGGMSVEDDSQNVFNGHVELINNSATYGGGLRVFEHSQCIFNSTALLSGNSAKNSGGSLLAQAESNISFLSEVNISTSTAGWEGGGILVRDDSLLEMKGETIMEYNNAISYGGVISLDFSELRIKGKSQMTNNRAQYGGAIQAVSSKVYIVSGDHYFENNSAEYGGGLALSGGSSIYFPYCYISYDPTSPLFHRLNIHFISNSAEQYGGAIWVESTAYYSCISNTTEPRCFLRGDEIDSFYPYIPDPPRFTAINNTAAKAGSNIHGGNLDSCSNGNEALLLKNSLFESSISSDPYRVCLCTNSEPDCSKSQHSAEIFSGEQLQLSLVGVGQRNATVPAVILSSTDPPKSTDAGSETQKSPGSCKDFSYTITSDTLSVKLMLYPESMCPNTSLEVLTVTVEIKPCPPGFTLHNQTKSCTCDKKLDENFQCDINSQSFSHQHSVWIGYDQLNDLNETVIYHPHCPFDYCTQELSNFTLNSTDNQCSYNRSGFICGACRDNYSLTLGGSKCKECSHVYFVLLIPLALAGVVLVLFLLTFKLTVSMGTINGLIFFANVIGTNSSIFLPPESTVVLRVFIAWLNLDLGIDTCLFDGLDMYIKVWLQFVFPFYVFALIGIIIFVSQYSILVTRYLGSDPVAVLATLILVAYTKLLRAVLMVMSFTYIRGFDGSSIAVWLYDGNVQYLSGKHIPLFIFALLIMLLLIIPYSVILLFGPYIQRHSKNKFFFWINDHRIKPFFHSYYAPLKDKYRSWIGLLLVLRLCLSIVFASNSLGDPSINLFAIAVVVVLLFSWRMLSGTVYTNWCLDALETFFLMKLGLFSISTLYVRNTSGNQRALADTLVGIAFIVSIAITVYHGWRQLTDSRWWRLTLKPKWQKYFNDEDPGVQEDGEAGETQLLCPQVPTTYVELPRQHVPTSSVDLRESLLESC